MLRLMLPLVLPDHVPVYVTTPTAPKLIELPVRVPLICRVSRGDVSWISPWSAEPLSFHWSTNVPLKGPLYCPVQFPDRSTIGVGVGAGMGVGVAVAVAVAAGVGVPLVVDALHPPSPIAARARTRARNLLRNIDLASSWVTGKVCSRGAPLFRTYRVLHPVHGLQTAAAAGTQSRSTHSRWQCGGAPLLARSVRTPTIAPDALVTKWHAGVGRGALLPAVTSVVKVSHRNRW